jgi:photosystem II stability/assembly factor-like uncharacterized protein/lysophospholipase L1-like esterase
LEHAVTGLDWIVAAAVVLLLAMASELAARWWLRYRGRYYVFPPGLRLHLRPDPEVLPQVEPLIRFEINSEGERGDEVPRLRSGSRLYRVLVAGGSQPEGYLLDQATSWPGALQRLLQAPERLQRLGASRVHVGNIARTGIGSEALDLVLERVLPRYPRLQAIIILVGVSDVFRWLERGAPPTPALGVRGADVFMCHPEGPFGWKPKELALVELQMRLRRRWLRAVHRHERAGSWIGKARAMRARAREVRTTMPDPAPMLDHFEVHLRQLLQKTRAHADRVLLVRQPWFGREYTPAEAAHMWHGGVGQVWREEVTTFYSFEVVSRLMALLDARAARVAAELDVEQVDLMPRLEQSLEAYQDFCHLTAAGAKAVADAVAAALLRQPLPPPGRLDQPGEVLGLERPDEPAPLVSFNTGGAAPHGALAGGPIDDFRRIARGICGAVLVLGLSWVGGVEPAAAGSDVWTVDGPDGGSINTLAIDPQTPTTLYAATGNGVFKSEDGGGSWDAANNGLTNRFVLSLAIDPRTPAALYVGTGGGLFKSTDSGRSWRAVSSSLANSAVRALAIDPQTPTILYASINDALSKSTDGGSTWSTAESRIRFEPAIALVIDPQTPTTLYAGTRGGGVFKSSDGGGSWSAINVGLTNFDVNAVAINPQVPTTLYAGTHGGVFESTHGGGSWSAINGGLTDRRVAALAIDPQTPTTLYAGTRGGGVFKSSDGGRGWDAVDTGLTSLAISALAINPQVPTTLYAGSSWAQGVFKSTDGGGSWGTVNSGLINTVVFAVAIDPESVTTVYAATNNGLHQSTTGGDTWRSLNTGLYAFALAIDPRSPTTLYAGGNGVFKSTNGGESWSQVGLAGTSVSSLVIDPHSPNILYAGTTSSSGVFRSLDGGATWSAVNTGLTARNVWSLAIDARTPSTLYAGTGYNYPDICRGVFKSTDGGSSWIELGPRDRSISAVAIDPQTPATLYASSSEWACGGGGPQDPGVYKSTDGGASWMAVNPRLTTVLAIDAASPTTVYAGTEGGVFKTADGGAHWTAMNEGLTNPSVHALAIDHEARATLYAGTAGGGVFTITMTPRVPLTVSTSGLGMGIVSSSPPGIDSVTMSEERSVTANFLGIPLAMDAEGPVGGISLGIPWSLP